MFVKIFFMIPYDTILLTCYNSTLSSIDMCHISQGRYLLTVIHIYFVLRCYDITQLSHSSLVNCVSDERETKFTNPQILNVHGIMKSTERHTADTQITDSAVICFISAI
jgi:hypothetical protein